MVVFIEIRNSRKARFLRLLYHSKFSHWTSDQIRCEQVKFCQNNGRSDSPVSHAVELHTRLSIFANFDHRHCSEVHVLYNKKYSKKVNTWLDTVICSDHLNFVSSRWCFVSVSRKLNRGICEISQHSISWSDTLLFKKEPAIFIFKSVICSGRPTNRLE